MGDHRDAWEVGSVVLLSDRIGGEGKEGGAKGSPGLLACADGWVVVLFVEMGSHGGGYVLEGRPVSSVWDTRDI